MYSLQTQKRLILKRSSVVSDWIDIFASQIDRRYSMTTGEMVNGRKAILYAVISIVKNKTKSQPDRNSNTLEEQLNDVNEIVWCKIKNIESVFAQASM